MATIAFKKSPKRPWRSISRPFSGILLIFLGVSGSYYITIKPGSYYITLKPNKYDFVRGAQEPRYLWAPDTAPGPGTLWEPLGPSTTTSMGVSIKAPFSGSFFEGSYYLGSILGAPSCWKLPYHGLRLLSSIPKQGYHTPELLAAPGPP